jgi:hypothetical protein
MKITFEFQKIIFVVIPLFLYLSLSVKAESIYILEVFPDPVGTDIKEEYIKIINLLNVPVEIGNIKIDGQSLTPLFSDYSMVEPFDIVVVYDDSLEISNKSFQENYKQATIPTTGLRNTNDEVMLLYMDELIDSFNYSSTKEGIPIIKPILSCSTVTNKLLDGMSTLDPDLLGGIDLVSNYPEFTPILQIKKGDDWEDSNIEEITEGTSFRFIVESCGVISDSFEWGIDNETWHQLETSNILNHNSEKIFLRYQINQEIFEYSKQIQTDIRINELWANPLNTENCGDDIPSFLTFPWIELEGEIPNNIKQISIETDTHQSFNLEYLPSLSSNNFFVLKQDKPLDKNTQRIDLVFQDQIIESITIDLSSHKSSWGRTGDLLESGYQPTPGGINVLEENILLITEISPYPSTGNEWLKLKNNGKFDIVLSNTFIQDRSSKKIQLDCVVLNPNQEIVLDGKKLPVTLNNDGDEVFIFDIFDNLITEASYPKSKKDDLWILKNGEYVLYSPQGNNPEQIDSSSTDDLIEQEEYDDEIVEESTGKVLSTTAKQHYFPYQVPRVYSTTTNLDELTEIALPQPKNNSKVLRQISGVSLMIGGFYSLLQIKESKEFLIGLLKALHKRLLS